MRQIFAAFLLAALAAGAAVAAPAPAAAEGSADPALTAVIDRQLAAFAAGDRQAAFAQAAPAIQARFPDPDIFMRMVTTGYGALIGPKATTFLAPEALSGGRVLQPMALIDAEGQGWTAFYTMEPQADGGWKIAGCRLARNPDAGV
ncbi:MAG: DUF4864 domain-containing protein [Alphaproteobacteria bacterium]|nr:DUF4864 domain-containing protein [Alphaproteobacteria bacterium]